MEISSYMDPNTRTVAYDYYYNFLDIIVTNIDTSGNVLWTKKIPKNQITVNDNGLYSSYVSGIVNDQLVFVFSDHPKNIHTSMAEKPMNNPKSSEVTIVSIDNVGNLNKQSLFSSKLTKKSIKPYIYHTEDQELLIFITEDGRTECLSRIDFLTKQ